MMAVEIASKLPDTGTTIFTVMSQLASEHKAINLSQGFPDFSGAQELLDLVTHYMNKGFNQYAPMPGYIGLREAVVAKAEASFGRVYHPETEITITPGATEAIYAAITAVVKEGDEVIILEPAYDCYVPAIKLNGGIPVFSKLVYPDYSVDWEEVKGLVNDKTRMIIINSPHNPSGAALSKSDMETLEAMLSDTDIFVLSDEVYEHIIFDGHEHQSVARFPGLAERSFAIFSFGKTFHNTGWKIGYCLAPAALMKEFRKVHQFIVFTTNTPMQHALADFLAEPSHYLSLGDFYQEKRDYFFKLMEGSRFTGTPARGTYFQVLDYSDIADGMAEMELAEQITADHKVASIPMSSFYNDGVNNNALRFCFAKSKETLDQAAELLCKI
jgi:methionine aminotransferase